MRLDRVLANSGYGSRSEVKNMIRQGRILVDGLTIRDSGLAIDENGSQDISIDGKSIRQHRWHHLMLYKPSGLITALFDPRHRTISELIPPQLLKAGLFPVGRLDLDATGLLLLTNDGTLCHRLASPRWQVWKTYQVTTQGRPFAEEDCQIFADGLILPDGQHCRPARLLIQDAHQALLTIHEGKYHQVKRMMLGTGRKVETLHRSTIGPLILDEKLAPGEFRELTEQETLSLYELVNLVAPDNQ